MMKYPSFISSSMFISAVALAMLYLPACKKQAPAIAPLTHPGYHQQALGASAIDLLRADKFSSVTVEIQHMPGATPHAFLSRSKKCRQAASNRLTRMMW
jgi:hypothetical protein